MSIFLSLKQSAKTPPPISRTDAGMSTLGSFSQALNAASSMVSNPSDSVSSWSAVLLLKALSPIDRTLGGITILGIEVHPLKAQRPMVVTVLGISRFARAPHSVNANGSMISSPLAGRETVSSFSQLSKAPSPISLRLGGSIILGRLIHARNELSPMRLRPSGTLMLVSRTQLLKALLPIVVIPDEIVIVSICSRNSPHGAVPSS